MHTHENVIPLGGEKGITGGFVSHSTGSEQGEIKKGRLKGTFVSVFVEGRAWLFMPASSVHDTIQKTVWFVSQHRRRSEGREMACVPLVAERCAVRPAISGGFWWRRDGQDNAAQDGSFTESSTQIKERNPVNSHSSHTRTEPQSNWCHSLVYVWCGGSNATAPTTSADQPEKKSGVKMSDSPLYRTPSARKNQVSCRSSHLTDRQTPSVALSCPSSFSNANTHMRRPQNGDAETLIPIGRLPCTAWARSLPFPFLFAAVYLRWKYLHVTAPADTMHMW